MLLGLLLAGCFSETYRKGYIVPEGALEQIPIGSSQEQVLLVLGTPSTVATVTGEAFYYISQRSERAVAFLPTQVTDQRVVAVYFDKNRRVERLADYGMKDGKIFDFVSRTTPTGGKDTRVDYRHLQDLLARVREHGEQQQRHDVGDLDHGIDRRSGGVLVGIAHGIAGDGGLVGLGALPAVVAVLDVLLGIVPGASA